MTSKSVSSSPNSSFYQHPIEFSEEKTMSLYHDIKMNLQDIQKIAEEFNDNLKTINENANISSRLIAAIQDKMSENGADTNEN